MKITKEIVSETEGMEWNEGLEKFVDVFAWTCTGVLNPICAFAGGFVAQEIIKAITQKFSPINQWFYYDATEIV